MCCVVVCVVWLRCVVVLLCRCLCCCITLLSLFCVVMLLFGCLECLCCAISYCPEGFVLRVRCSCLSRVGVLYV